MKKSSESAVWWRRLGGGLLSIAAALGCGPSQPPAHPVSGEVLVNGQAVEGVKVRFFALQPPPEELLVPIPRGHSGPDGELHVSTYEGGDGAPAGEYRLTAVWMTERPEGADPEAFATRDRLGGKYADPATSGLVATIEPGDNRLPPFELTSVK